MGDVPGLTMKRAPAASIAATIAGEFALGLSPELVAMNTL
jgi:hypothetical protein